MGSVKGSVYKRGRYWWIQYIDNNSERHQESCETTKKTVAREILNQRLELVAKDEPIIAEKIKFSELLEDLETHYKIKKQDLKPSIKESLLGAFGGMIASRITTADIEHYIVELQKEKEDSDKKKKKGLSAATVNRRLAAIKTAFRLGMKRTPPKVTRAPHIPMLTEDNTRTGFLEHHQALKLRDALPSFLQGFFWFGYSTGWRIDEIRNLTDRNFDELGQTIRLFPGTTKNKEGRTLYLDDELFSIIQAQRQNRPAGRQYLFYGETGEQIKDIRGSWKTA